MNFNNRVSPLFTSLLIENSNNNYHIKSEICSRPQAKHETQIIIKLICAKLYVVKIGKPNRIILPFDKKLPHQNGK